MWRFGFEGTRLTVDPRPQLENAPAAARLTGLGVGELPSLRSG